MLLFGHFNDELLSCYHNIYMNYCHVVMYTYHKTNMYEVEAKVHASLLLDTLNFWLFTIFIVVFLNIHESKSHMLCK